jgi:hypothetical protein
MFKWLFLTFALIWATGVTPVMAMDNVSIQTPALFAHVTGPPVVLTNAPVSAFDFYNSCKSAATGPGARNALTRSTWSVPARAETLLVDQTGAAPPYTLRL